MKYLHKLLLDMLTYPARFVFLILVVSMMGWCSGYDAR